MNEKIRADIDQMFKDMPKTRTALELKEEIIANAQEKMRDLLDKGYQEEDAYGVVINSIGNVEELFQDTESTGGDNQKEWEEYSKKRAKIKAISVGLYILAVAVFLFFVLLGESGVRIGNFEAILLGLVIAAVICAVPTMMLVYVKQLIPHYRKKDDSMVEEYRTWKMGNEEDKEVMRAINSIITSLMLTIYFTVSILTGAWYITWVIFIIAECIRSIVRLIFSMNKQKEDLYEKK